MSASEGRVTPDNIEEALGRWLRSPGEKDRVFPKGKKVEVVFLVEAVNALLLRTEGVEDITLFKLPGTEYEVPAILPEKLQAVSRRRMLAYLRRFRDNDPGKLAVHLKALAEVCTYEKKSGGQSSGVKVGFAKAEETKEKPAEWNCYVQPPGGDARNATDVGMDGFCPACALFGAVIDGEKLKGLGNESIGLKSRVEFDPAVAFLDQEKTVVGYTHNKVADGVSWTGQGLYMEHHVAPGTVFAGKVTLEDVTPAELKAFLATLSAIDRLGGRERLFGGVRVHLVAVRGGSYETVSALGIAKKLAERYGGAEYPPGVEEVKRAVVEELGEGFKEVDGEKFRKLVDADETWDSLWRDTVDYDRQVVERVMGLLGKTCR